MDKLFDIGFLILSQIAVGGTLLMNLLDIRITGKVLFRTNGILFLISITLALFLFSFNHQFSVTDRNGIGICLLVYMVFLFLHLLTLWLGRESLGKGALWISSAVGLIGLVWSGVAYSRPLTPDILTYLLPINFCFSALLMGAGLVGMNLGHCYLTNIHLPISPYKRLSYLFLLFLIFQALVSLISLVQLRDFDLIKKAIYLENIEGLFLWIRILIGFLAPLVLIFMILHTVRIRSTQSATGLMYVAMMMVISGEFFSRFFLLASQRLL